MNPSRVAPAGRRRNGVVVALLGALLLGACGSDDGAASAPTTTATPGGAASPSSPADCPDRPVERLEPVVERQLDHDPTSFTQGFVIAGDTLYESTGLVGRSSVIAADAGSGEVEDRAPVPDGAFAEGLTVRPDGSLVQLTWTEGRAFVRDPGTLEIVDEFTYDGEGWGLSTLDDGTLVMSDGSDRITVRDPETFEEIDSWTVARSDGPADQLNELEWDGEHLWANRWKTDEIVRIDLACRRVDAVVDASALTAQASTAARADGSGSIDVLNGIAHVPGTDRYLLTGKRWPVTFDVRFAPAGSGG